MTVDIADVRSDLEGMASCLAAGVLRLLIAAATMPQRCKGAPVRGLSIALMRERKESVHGVAAISDTNAPQRGG
jgi:hypothetical protein